MPLSLSPSPSPHRPPPHRAAEGWVWGWALGAAGLCWGQRRAEHGFGDALLCFLPQVVPASISVLWV